MRKVIDIIAPEHITYIVASHQDPDICGSLAVTEDIINNSDLQIVAHSKTIRLIRHHGLRSPFYATDKESPIITLKSGRELECISSPYLHAPGAIVTYDRQTKTLFSSDLFGAISQDWSLFAKDDYLTPMRIFHEIYMPSNAILKKFLTKLKNYDIERIAPQHGSVIEGNNVQEAIDFLMNVKCGIDLE